jgi:soluble lytic murein transglycosylase-like protein
MMFSMGLGWVVATLVMNIIAPPTTPSSVDVKPSAPALASAPLQNAAPALSPIFTPEVQHWAERIVAWATPFNLDPNLVATVMQIESCGGPSAVSRSGAQGLFQVMPFHFAPGETMQDPDTNAHRGLTYLALGLSRANGDAGLALAGYNGGHSQIGKVASLWPNQTQRYWYWGTGIYAEALSGQTTSARLQEWLEAGGASLCAKAAQELGLQTQ